MPSEDAALYFTRVKGIVNSGIFGVLETLRGAPRQLKDDCLVEALRSDMKPQVIAAIVKNGVSPEIGQREALKVIAKRGAGNILPLDQILDATPMTPMPSDKHPAVRFLRVMGMKNVARGVSDVITGMAHRNEHYRANRNATGIAVSTIFGAGLSVASVAGVVAGGPTPRLIATLATMAAGSEIAIGTVKNLAREGAVQRVLSAPKP